MISDMQRTTAAPQTSDRTPGFWQCVRRILMGGLILVLLLGAVTWIAGMAAKTNLAKQYPPPGQIVDVGGHTKQLNCIGQGSPTVILEAGWGDFSIFWARVQPEVARFARVCAYDRAGLGWSGPSPTPRTSGNIVNELHRLLVTARVAGPYVLVGHSFGGALVRLYAHQYPHDVVGMVLLDSVPDELFLRAPAFRTAHQQQRSFYRTLAALRSVGVLALMPETIPNRGLPDAALAQYRAVMATTSYLETAIAESAAMEQSLAEVRAADARRLGNMPLIVLSRGKWDALPGATEAENQQAWQAWQAMQSELATLSSNSTQLIVEPSGHNVHLEQPQLVIDAIRQIVQSAREAR